MERQISFETGVRAALVSQIREQFLISIPFNVEARAAEGRITSTVRVKPTVPVGSVRFMDRLAEDKIPCSDGVTWSQHKDFIAWLLSKEDLVAHAHTFIPPHVATVQVVHPTAWKSKWS
jgi:hypothetical protein